MSTTSSPPTAAPPQPLPPVLPKSAQRRRDIQGLRGVAVLLVLVYHAGLPWAGGGYVGVDVFFVISGFLITGLVVREVETTGRLDLIRFWSRRIRRLLPTATVVLLCTVGLTLLALPATRWQAVLGDIRASALYLVNWRLAATSTDYLAEGTAASPVQHYWSLAVEEQFYVLWPLLVLVCLIACRVTARSLRQSMAVVLAVVALPSLLWSIWYTDRSAAAYFVTTTRLWELAAGAALALATPWLDRIGKAASTALGWGGLAAIVTAGLFYTSSTPFPGAAALLPVLGAAAVVAAGAAAPARGVSRLLGWRPLTQVGDISYPLYLWHWPLVVVGTAVFTDEDSGLWWVTGMLLVSAAVVPAWLTHTVVETPLRHRQALLRGPFAVLLLIICTLLPIGATAGVQHALDDGGSSAPASPGAAELPQIGAVLLAPDPRTSPAGEAPAALGQPRPSLFSAVDDNPDVYSEGCHVDEQTVEPRACSYGPADAGTKVALVGDSHAASWQPAVRWVAEQRGWRLDVYTKSACGWFDAAVAGNGSGEYSECTEWNTRLQQRLTTSGYDLVLTSGDNLYTVLTEDGAASGSRGETALAESYARVWRAAETAGVDVVALANTPRMDRDVPECLARYEDPRRCTTARERALEFAGTVQADAVATVPAVNLLDLNDWICPTEECSPLIGGAIVWRDSHHLTATYSRSLAPALEDALDAAGKPD